MSQKQTQQKIPSKKELEKKKAEEGKAKRQRIATDNQPGKAALIPPG